MSRKRNSGRRWLDKGVEITNTVSKEATENPATSPVTPSGTGEGSQVKLVSERPASLRLEKKHHVVRRVTPYQLAQPGQMEQRILAEERQRRQNLIDKWTLAWLRRKIKQGVIKLSQLFKAGGSTPDIQEQPTRRKKILE